MFDAYRSAYRDSGLPGGGGMAFMPLVYTADNEAEAEKGAQELTWYLKAKVEPQFRNPPGYVPVALNVKALQGAYAGRTAAMRAQAGVSEGAGRRRVRHARLRWPRRSSASTSASAASITS